MTKPKHSAENERIKRRYLIWLKEAKGYSTASIDMAAAAISRFEAYTNHRDFKRFHVELAIAFKSHLAGKAVGVQSGTLLSKATVASTLRHLKAFFSWLADRPGYKSTVRYSDAAYFTPLGQDERIANATRNKPVPEFEEITRTLLAMPAETEIERRDRAVFAFIFLTAARDRAVASFKLKHVDLSRGTLFQDAREVRTKRAKTFVTGFFPVGDEPGRIISEWISFLKVEKGFGSDDPLFPATLVALDGNQQFAAAGIGRTHWMTTTPIRKIFANAFQNVGLPYFNPHSVRSTVTRLGERRCRTAEEFKAWSQNLGHEKVMTTFSIYGKVAEERQMEIIAGLGRNRSEEDDLAGEIARVIRNQRSRAIS